MSATGNLRRTSRHVGSIAPLSSRSRRRLLVVRERLSRSTGRSKYPQIWRGGPSQRRSQKDVTGAKLYLDEHVQRHVPEMAPTVHGALLLGTSERVGTISMDAEPLPRRAFVLVILVVVGVVVRVVCFRLFQVFSGRSTGSH